MIANYTANFQLITDRVRIENSPYDKCILRNGFLEDAVKYFKKKKRLDEAKPIIALNNSAPDVWTVIQTSI